MERLFLCFKVYHTFKNSKENIILSLKIKMTFQLVCAHVGFHCFYFTFAFSLFQLFVFVDVFVLFCFVFVFSVNREFEISS